VEELEIKVDVEAKDEARREDERSSSDESRSNAALVEVLLRMVFSLRSDVRPYSSRCDSPCRALPSLAPLVQTLPSGSTNVNLPYRTCSSKIRTTLRSTTPTNGEYFELATTDPTLRTASLASPTAELERLRAVVMGAVIAL
jgi:hypothetical protein